jgi:tellurite methyltransferase
MLAERERLEVLGRLIGHVNRSGWVLIADEPSNMDGFKSVLNADGSALTVLRDGRGYLFAQRG